MLETKNAIDETFMSKKLSKQAEYIKKEFNTIPDEDIIEIDKEIKKWIRNTSEKGPNDVAKYVEKQISEKYQSANARMMRKKARKIARKYLENNRIFNLQEGWYGVLAYFLALITMVLRVINADTKTNDFYSFISYFGAIGVWFLIDKTKHLMNEKAERFVNQFNKFSGSLAIIGLAVFYLFVILWGVYAGIAVLISCIVITIVLMVE